MGQGAQIKIVGIEAVRALALGALYFGLAQARLDRADDAQRDLVLQFEDVVQRAVIALGPDMHSARRLDQLRGDPHAVPDLAQAAFKHIAYAELAADLLQINRAAFISKGRVAGDDVEPSEPRQPGDDVLDDTVDEILLLGIAAHIGERHHRNRWPVIKTKRILGPGVRRFRTWLGSLLDAVDAHRPRDVLDTVLTEIGKPDRQLFADLLAHRVADADLAGGGKRLDPRRDVDAIAKHVAFVDHDVAEVDADAKANALALRQIGVAVLHPPLHDDRATHRIDDRGELDQHAVAGGLKDAPAVLIDQRVDQFTPVRLESGERLFLVRPHQPRIFDDIGAEDRRQPPLNPFLRQSPPSFNRRAIRGVPAGAAHRRSAPRSRLGRCGTSRSRRR